MPGGWIKAGTLADGDLLNDTLESELIEAAAYDDDDASQGTYILQVLHGDYAPEGGVLLTARYLAAKDDYYNYWMRSGGRPIKDVYHVCAAAGCRGGPKGQIHIESWRPLGREDIEEGRLAWAAKPGLQKRILEALREGAEPGGESGAERRGGEATPLADGERPPGRSPSGRPAAEPRAEALGEPPPAGRGAPDGALWAGARSVRPRRGVGEELEELRAGLEEGNNRHGLDRPDRARGHRSRRRARAAESGAARPAVRQRVRGAGESPARAAAKRRARAAGNRAQGSGQETGPAGAAAVGDRSSTTQGRLMRFARENQGRLAEKLLWKMASRVTPGGEADSDSENQTGAAPAVASAYHLRVLSTQQPPLSKRNANEMRLMCKMLDLLSRNKVKRAMDFAAQHLKAIEQSVADGGWTRARFLELFEEDAPSLVGRGEKYMMRSEVRAEQALALRSGSGPKGAPKGARSDEAGAAVNGATESRGKGEAFSGKGFSFGAASKSKAKGKDKELVHENELWAFFEDALTHLDTPLGRHASLDPPSGTQPASDLLPMPAAAAREHARSLSEAAGHDGARASHCQAAVWCMTVALNFVAQAAWAGDAKGSPSPGPRPGLTTTQQHAAGHLWEAAAELLAEGGPAPSARQIRADLATRQTDYMGEPVSVRRQLVASKVLPAWPRAGEAAAVPVTRFLDGELLDDVLNPSSCLLPPDEWPLDPPCSRVHASDREWYKIVKEGAARGIFAEVPEDKIFRDPSGRLVVNGAMGIDKPPKSSEEGETLLRFISIFTPINAYLRKLRGDDHTLPVAALLSACILEDGEEFWDDAEDQKGCFNIFRLPEEWLGYCAYSKQVPASAFGGDPNRLAWVAMRCVAMGSKIAVSIMQRVMRVLVFEESTVDAATELRRDAPVPEDSVSVVCLDGFDFVRKAQTRLQHLQAPESEEHIAFVGTCARYGIPLNPAKSLVAKLNAGILGGLLRGDKGWLAVAPDKARALAFKGAVLATQSSWSAGALQHWAGQACFAAGFRRPLFAVLEQVFPTIQLAASGPIQASAATMDEIIAFTLLLPLAYTNLRAQVKRAISCTDASEHGGGAAEATTFVRTQDPQRAARFEAHFARLAEDSSRATGKSAGCVVCGTSLPENAWAGNFARCPAACGAVMCSVDCVLTHRRVSCDLAGERLFSFFEGHSGPDALLTWAVACSGVEICLPLDPTRVPYSEVLRESGRKHIHLEADDEATAWEHWNASPEWQAHSRSLSAPGGKPAKIGSLAFARLQWRLANWGFAVVQAPAHDPLWYTPEALAVSRRAGVHETAVVLDYGGAGGQQEVWFLHNCRALCTVLPGAPGQATSREAFRTAYAGAVTQALKDLGAGTLPLQPTSRPEWIRDQLAQERRKAYSEGATWLWLLSGSLDRVMVVGRWQHANTARIYIETAAAELGSWKHSDRAESLIHQAGAAGRRALLGA
ncbi:unnamed protein product [Prorocentrum cordatum]|uniref:Uncharacterized protein n=1 Tax=Prorocentrum cordatum TaxID=2364126 RepID=A0ABN9QYK2_9DINO|nr:unnamed protein product [Polarella glacialis]